tara:strand:- start:9 stop:305 length:297 start_codon:yes stop_codon:yes gene_type:complete
MKKLKLSFILLSLVFLNGCLQTTALLGPGITVVTSGNVLQAGLQYGANSAIKNEIGQYPLEYIKNSVEEKNNQKKLQVELKNFLENRIEATRKKLSLN